MDGERWKRIDDLLQSALRLPADQQKEFLRNACAGDSSLEAEVLSLISSHQKLGNFLEEPPVTVATLSGFPDSPEALVGKTIAHYRVLHRLGSGGMGVVYEGEDIRLGRHVALKFLLESHGREGKSLVRFQQEARAISTLNNPHICTVYEIEEHDGKPVIVMELLEGETLMDRLRAGRLPLSQVRQWGMEVADALEAAHAAGLVHRDIKPANVFITRRATIKVLDFGLAKLTAGSDSSGSHEESLTTMGVIPGTSAYMSPEQIRGDELDGRTDVFSLGVMLYEMVTGERPFAQKNTAMTMDAVLHKQPVSPRELNPDLPPRLEAIINKAMEKDRGQRYRSAAELYSDLAQLGEGSSGTAGVFRSPVIALPGAGSSGSRRVTSSAPMPRRWLFVAGLGVALVVAAVVFVAVKFRSTARPATERAAIKARRSVAVLGFRNLSGNADQEWVSTALSEMLGTELASGNELRVISGENVARMKRDLSLPATDSYSIETLSKIRQNLGADQVVLGSYLAMGKDGPLRIDLRVQDAGKGETVAAVSQSGSEAELADLVSRTGSNLREKLGIGNVPEDELHRVGTSLPSNPEAVRLYSEGLGRLRTLDAKAARNLFEKAIVSDPNHALSHSFLARSFQILGYEAQAKVEATKAFELSQNLPRRDRLLVEGSYRELQNDLTAAIEAYRTLWEFFPDDVDSGLRLAAAQTSAGKGKDALVTVEQMRELPEPANHDPRIDLAESVARESQGDFRQAQQRAAAALDAASRQGSRTMMMQAHSHEAWDWDRLGQLDKASAEFAELRDLSLKMDDPMMAAQAWNGIGVVHYDKGEFDRALQAWNEGLAISRRLGALHRVAAFTSNIGNVYYERGKMEEARRHYQEALDIDREIGSPNTASDLGSLANVMDSVGDLAGAVKLQELSLEGFRKSGNKRGEATTLVNLADVLREEGQFAAATARYEDAMKVAEQTGHRRDDAYAEYGIADILRYQDRLAEARAKAEESITLRRELGSATDIAYSQVLLAQIAIEEGKAEEAAKLAQDGIGAFAKQNMLDAGCQAQAVLSLALVAKNMVDEAKKAAARSAQLCHQGSDRTAKFESALAEAAVRCQEADYNGALRVLEGVRAQASKFGYVSYDLESRLQLGRVELKSGKLESGRGRLSQLQSDAKAQGFPLIARKAAQTLQAH